MAICFAAGESSDAHPPGGRRARGARVGRRSDTGHPCWRSRADGGRCRRPRHPSRPRRCSRRRVQVHARGGVELVLDGAEMVVRRAVGNEVHPLVGGERRGRLQGAGRARVKIRIQALERLSYLLEQRARVVVVFERGRQFARSPASLRTAPQVAHEPADASSQDGNRLAHWLAFQASTRSAVMPLRSCRDARVDLAEDRGIRLTTGLHARCAPPGAEKTMLAGG